MNRKSKKYSQKLLEFCGNFYVNIRVMIVDLTDECCFVNNLHETEGRNLNSMDIQI